MKTQFNFKNSSSPFYEGPGIYVDNNSGWSFSKKTSSGSKYWITITILVVTVLYFIIF